MKKAKVDIKGSNNEVNVNSVVNKVNLVDEITELTRKGNFTGAADLLSRVINSAAAQHPVYPYWHYKFDVNNCGNIVISHVPTNAQAAITHPLHCNMRLVIPDEYKQFRNMDELLKYSYNKQIPLQFDANFVQTMIGETIINELSSEDNKKVCVMIKPKKFPNPRPFKIYFKNNTFSIDYLLIGVQKIEGSVIYLTNNQQVKSKLIIELAIDVDKKTGSFSIKIPEIYEFDTEANLMLNKFLYLASEKEEFALKSLEDGCDIFEAKGLKIDVDDIEQLNNIVTLFEILYKIERHFKIKLSVPDRFTQNDLDTIALLDQILEDKPIEGVLTELSLKTNDKESIKNMIINTEQYTNGAPIVAHIPNQIIQLFGAEIVFNKELKCESVKPKDLDRLKRKFELMDMGDTIEIIYIPGDSFKCTAKFSVTNPGSAFDSN